MSKNLTLKGAAFGALVALSVSAVAPASAAGLADTSYVSLAPATGTEYTVLTGASKAFELKSNFASSVAGTGRNLKFLVNDVDNKFDAFSTTTYQDADTTSTWAYSTSTVVVQLQGALDAVIGDRIFVTGLQNSTGDSVNNGFQTITAISNSAGTSTVSFTGTTGETPGTGTPRIYKAADADVSASNHAFVVDSQSDSNAADKKFKLVTGSAEDSTRSVDVTAWVDNNGNNEIDATEYVSPTRTVKFIKASELAITSVLDPASVGDTSLTGYATTVPVLNGDQLANTDATAVFTRQGTADTESDSTGTWSDTTKKWSFSQSLTPAASTWTSLKEVGIASVSIAGSSGSEVLTVNTTAAHGLTSGDDILISGITATGTAVDGIKTNPTVTDADTFTVAAAGTTAASLGTSPFVGGSRVVAGTYSIKASFAGSAGAAAGSSDVATKKVSTVTSAVTSGTGVAADGDVKTGTKTVTVTATVKDSASAVLAGRQVKVTATGITGTHYLNGTKVANNDYIWVTSDANGVATVTVTSDTAAASDNLDLAFASEGISADAVNLDWMNSTYVIHEGTSGDTSTDTRTVNKSGSLTLDLNVVDDWGVAIDSSIYRLKVAASNRQVFTKFVTLSAGKASVTVTDENISGTDITVVVTLQKLVSGTWGDSSAPSLARTFTVNTVDQTDAVLLDADAATTYGSGTADLSDAVAGSAVTVVADATLNNGAVFTDGAAVAVTGRVANASTYVGRAGSVVTVSGSSDFLFVVGNKSAKGSLTFVADSNGEFNVAVLSNKAAKDSVVTVSSNGKSATAKVTFTPLAAVNTGITFEAVSTSLPGRTIDLSVKFTDKWGNLTSTSTAGTATFTATGPGWLVTNNSAVTSVDGVASNKLITNPEDAGTAVIAVTTNINDADGVAIKLTKSIVIGAAPVVATAAASGSTAKIYASATNSAGKTVVVKVNGKTVKSFAGTTAKKTVVVAATAGAKNVSVFVGGVKVLGKVVTVK